MAITIDPADINALATLPVRVQELMALRGKIVSMRIRRDAKIRAAFKNAGVVVEKESYFICRVGVDYNKMASVQEKREDGRLPEEPQSLPWGRWMVFPYVIEHKGNHYFRCTTFNSNNFVRKVQWLKDGQPITVEEAKEICLNSEFQEKDDQDVFTVKVESILEINKQEV